MTTAQLKIAVIANLPGLVCSVLWARGLQMDNQLYGWVLVLVAPLSAIGWLGGLGLATYATWQYSRREHVSPEVQRSFWALLGGWLLLIPLVWVLAQYAALMR